MIDSEALDILGEELTDRTGVTFNRGFDYLFVRAADAQALLDYIEGLRETVGILSDPETMAALAAEVDADLAAGRTRSLGDILADDEDG